MKNYLNTCNLSTDKLILKCCFVQGRLGITLGFLILESMFPQGFQNIFSEIIFKI